jgi:hypothetical protein
MSLSLRISAVLCGLLVAATVQASAVYKWTDDKGVVQYTDAPPEGRKFERLDVRESGKASAAVASEDESTEASAAAADASAPTPAQRRLDVMKANCQTARDNLATLQTGQAVNADLDGDGSPEELDAAGRAKATKAALEQMNQNCVE